MGWGHLKSSSEPLSQNRSYLQESFYEINLITMRSNGNKDSFIGGILANMTQVSDVAHGPLVFLNLQLTVRHGDRDQTRIVNGEEKAALKALAKHKTPKAVMKSFMKLKSYNSAVLQIVKNNVNLEVCQLLKKSSGLLSSDPKQLLNFDWKGKSEIVKSIAPNLFDILSSISLVDSRHSLPKMMASLHVLLYGRCQRFNQLQYILGLVLDQCGLTKEVQCDCHVHAKTEYMSEGVLLLVNYIYNIYISICVFTVEI
jgi:hypothetical protein